MKRTTRSRYHTAITNFLSIDPSVLKEAEPFIFLYYEDIRTLSMTRTSCQSNRQAESGITSSSAMSQRSLAAIRRSRGIYISLECNCDWEPEHGLQIVFKNGLKVNKVGPYDGHLTNSDAYVKSSLENVVYRKIM